MWVKFMDVPDGYAATIWMELFSAEAISVRVVPPLGDRVDARFARAVGPGRQDPTSRARC